jgi:hypothetical protein
VARDLRDVLDDAAGAPADLPDIDMIRRRARPLLIRRRAAAGLAVLGLTVASVVGTGVVLEMLSDHGTDVVQPVPAPAPRELRPGQLEPGTYTGHVGGYGLRLALPTDDWFVISDHATWLALAYRQYVVHLQVWGSVVPDESPDARATEATPPDIAAWLTSNDRITTTTRQPSEVGGVPATEIVVSVARPLRRSPVECTTSGCVALARIAGVGELVHIESDERARLLVLGDPGAQLVVTYRAPEDEFPVLDRAARDLLSGLRLTPSG